MSSIGHPGRLTVALTITLLAALPQLVMPHAVGAADDYAIDEETITITVNVELGGAGANAAIRRKWTKAFNEYWGKDAGPFTNGCRKVVLVPNIVMPGKGNNNYHLVAVVPKDPGHEVRSKIWAEPGYRPTEQNRAGNWAGDLPTQDVAHEFGHILGLGDEYLDVDANGKTVPRGTGVDSIPDPSIPDSRDSIMGLGNKVLQRHIVQIVKKHNIPRDKLRCHWKGTIEIKMTGASSGRVSGTNDYRFALAVDLNEDFEGVITGTADASIAYAGHGTQDCGTSTSAMSPNPILTRLSVSGKRSGEIMDLQLAASGPIAAVMTSTTCGRSYTYTSDMWQILRAFGNLHPMTRKDRTYILREAFHNEGSGWTSDVQIDGTIAPVTAEGKPVG